jgi:hypothetical protein
MGRVMETLVTLQERYWGLAQRVVLRLLSLPLLLESRQSALGQQ